ncbi:MAG: beta-Ala-His dipeptidase [Clostridia bacterium]|nr:beta-Ala-His dipeptidase [Clostridia bacterium]
MERVLAGYSPEKLYWYFEELTRIPRGSKNEKAVADFFCAEAEKLGLEWYRDELHNVLIKKPGCGGLENAKPVILQGHSDVVCEKNENVIHDFTRDPVEIYIEDGYLKTRGTTLGADNGTACAIMLAILAEKDVKHPPLECLFTTQEEIGMVGARAFDYSRMRGHTMINMDCGSIARPTVSCAGAEYDTVTFSFTRSAAEGEGAEIFLTGLAGGHSGTKAKLGRGNSILLLARILDAAREKAPFRLSFIEGGSKANAIPRECRARLVATDRAALAEAVKEAADALRRELVEADAALSVTVTPAEKETAFSAKETDDLLFFLNLVPNGVLSTVPDHSENVETSSNSGVIRTEGDRVILTIMPRSSSESRMDQIARRLDLLAGRVGASIRHDDRHAGWEFAPKSELREIYARVYREMTGEEPDFHGMHAGLECGVIGEGLGGVDALAMGVKAPGAHTPDEKLDLADLARVYEFLKRLLAAM